MPLRLGLWSGIAAAMALAAPLAARAQTAAFDGTYAGVSMKVTKTVPEAQRCPAGGVPQPFMIMNGAVMPLKGKGWTGSVGPQGAVTMQNQYAMHVTAQIDAQGNVAGKFTGPQCLVDFVWRKQG